ncbi:Translation elongation factor G paralog VC2342 [hydrothermal vent metagenome]|uniref:Translation elongation factor G paralog VC2342 n=1 Tax=hydrothermal vent metagenome TaxID=652676 RepID=A0A3B0WMX9_9ZZZZ
MGELHLDIKIDILKRTHGVDVEVGKPQVAYRETITANIEDSYTHKKQTGGSGQFGKIDYSIEPGETGSGYEFESKVTGGNVPKEYWSAIEHGFRSCMERGVLAGYPCVDLKFTLKDGQYHAVDSSTMTSGRGQFSMEFSHYMPCPSNISEEVIAEAKERNAKK